MIIFSSSDVLIVASGSIGRVVALAVENLTSNISSPRIGIASTNPTVSKIVTSP